MGIEALIPGSLEATWELRCDGEGDAVTGGAGLCTGRAAVRPGRSAAVEGRAAPRWGWQQAPGLDEPSQEKGVGEQRGISRAPAADRSHLVPVAVLWPLRGTEEGWRCRSNAEPRAAPPPAHLRWLPAVLPTDTTTPRAGHHALPTEAQTGESGARGPPA